MPSTLRNEIKQNKPFTSLEELVFLDALRTVGKLLDPEAALLRTHDLSFAQYNVLRILRGAREAGLSCGEISERMVHRDPDVTRLLDRLAGRGLVRRERAESDRRVVLSWITDEGLTLLQSLDEPINRLHKAQLGHMTQSQLETLAELLELARTPP